jgi:2-dehydropantoate 2-reductase
MLNDIAKGRTCEIDAINGVVCSYGDNVHVETPINDKIVEIVKSIESGSIVSTWDNLSLFDELI